MRKCIFAVRGDCDEENGYSNNETVLTLNLVANLIFRGDALLGTLSKQTLEQWLS